MTLTDYLRAPDPEPVIEAMQQHRPLIEPDGGLFDGLSANGIDPHVALDKLVGLIRDVPWAVDIMGSSVVWPRPHTRPVRKAEWSELPEDSPWATGPWLEELPDRYAMMWRACRTTGLPRWPSRGPGSRSSTRW